MTTDEFANAKSIWKFGYAEECFKHVANACAFILQKGIDENHPAYYPMIVAIYALYGKPFKQSNRGAGRLVGALPRNIVPAEFRPLHDVMIEHRDEVYAHTQPGSKSEVRVRVTYFGTTRVGHLFSTEFYARPPLLPKIIELCQAVQTAVEQRRVKLQDRYFDKHLPKEAGEYPLNVCDSAGPFFLPKQPPFLSTPYR
jgi:hypothetical protein